MFFDTYNSDINFDMKNSFAPFHFRDLNFRNVIAVWDCTVYIGWMILPR